MIIVDICRHIGKCRYDVEPLGINIRVLVVGCRPVKRSSSETINLYFAIPNIGIQSFEVILVDQAILNVG